ncbi:MAG: LysR family transcriptional regulator [Moraxellaceae bacterium]|nr:LysR family transcriptional regulator [Moraxellaceae bacterium]
MFTDSDTIGWAKIDADPRASAERPASHQPASIGMRTLRIHSAAILYFDAVRRAGSIREAARRLFVASSAVNRQIIKLEEEVGAKLFDRSAQGLRLTAAGEVLARHVMYVLKDLERTRSELAALNGLRIGRVDIAATEGVAVDMLPIVLTRMRERYPRIDISIRTMPSSRVGQSLVDGEADIGFSFSLRPGPELRQIALARFPIGALMSSDHPLAQQESVTLSQCIAYPLILPTPEASGNEFIQKVRKRAAEASLQTIEANSVQMIKHLAELGAGIAFQTRIGNEREIAAGRLRHVTLKGSDRAWGELGIYTLTGRSLPQAASIFLQLFLKELQDRESGGLLALDTQAVDDTPQDAADTEDAP